MTTALSWHCFDWAFNLEIPTRGGLLTIIRERVDSETQYEREAPFDGLRTQAIPSVGTQVSSTLNDFSINSVCFSIPNQKYLAQREAKHENTVTISLKCISIKSVKSSLPSFRQRELLTLERQQHAECNNIKRSNSSQRSKNCANIPCVYRRRREI